MQLDRRTLQYIWTLVFLGVGATMCALAIVAHALIQVHDVRQEASQQRSLLLGTSQRARRIASEAAEVLVEAFHDRPSTDVLLAEQLPRLDESLPLEHVTANAYGRLARALSSLDALTSEVRAWASNDTGERAELASVRRQAQDALVSLRGAVSSIDGRIELERAKRLHALRASTGLDPARLVEDALSRTTEVARTRRMEADIGRIAEILGHTLAADRDGLVDLKDNELVPAVVRLRHALHALPSDAALAKRSLEDIETALLGTPLLWDGADQTVRTSDSGLYSARLDQLRSEARRAELEGRRDSAIRELHAALHEFDDATMERMDATAADSIAVVERSEARLVWVVLGAVLVFGFIGIRLPGMIRSQFAQVATAAQVLTDANRQLDEARRQAEDGVRAKSEFLATMSHELRTPLTGVIGMSEVLLDTRLDGDGRECAETIRRCGEGLLTLINDILDLSRAEAGGVEIERIDFAVQDLVDAVRDGLGLRAQSKGLTLDVHVLEGTPAVIRGDVSRIRQILLNIVGNAVKFTDRGGIRVEMEVQHQGDVSALTVRVSDSGIGISKDAQRLLFQPFVQADASTSRRYGGSGLGLAISKRLVELMGGEIALESVPGLGSRFAFWVMVEPAATVALPPVAPTVPRRQLGLHVLVADDNATNRRVISALLHRLGCTSEEVENGAAALHAFGQSRFDLVLMDCQMPGMDGYTATGEIRRVHATHLWVPIIALTADAMPGVRKRCLAAGMDDYLAKPIRFAEFAAVLERHAASREVTELPEGSPPTGVQRARPAV